MPVYYQRQICGGEHPSPIVLRDGEAFDRSTLLSDSFQCPVKGESAIYDKVEIEEIDHEYPRLTEDMKPEKHQAAIRNITYAWQAEKQHRDLLKKVLSGTGIFFGVLAKKIERTNVQFSVCQRGGSTLTELPKDRCPICGAPFAQYREVERIK